MLTKPIYDFPIKYVDLYPCTIRDGRDDVNVRCSEGCATNQFYYLQCKYIGEEQVRLFRECGAPQYAEVLCTYNDRGY